MKRYVITGSVGHISKPIVEGLVKAGKDVTVITSKQENASSIETLGARAAVGSLADQAFMERALQGAEVVYTMLPPIWVTENWRASQNEQAISMKNAIESNGVKRVVNLSSVGADLEHGCGPVGGIYDFEQMLNNIADLDVVHLRAGYFYYNLFAQVGLIKGNGIMGGNFGGPEQKIPLVYHLDISNVALEELLGTGARGKTVRYVISDLKTTDEIAAIMSKAINKTVPWIIFTDADQHAGLTQAGLAPAIVDGYVEMGKALRDGIMQRDALKVAPDLQPTKLELFAAEFAKAYAA